MQSLPGPGFLQLVLREQAHRGRVLLDTRLGEKRIAQTRYVHWMEPTPVQPTAGFSAS